MRFQSSRSLRTATISGRRGKASQRHFNPRGPCGPRPEALKAGAQSIRRFQSSRSLRTATGKAVLIPLGTLYFNPRGPCGPRLLHKIRLTGASKISILAVLADRDLIGSQKYTASGVLFQSSRSLRTATLQSGQVSRASTDFNPRGPCGPRPSPGQPWPTDNTISILAVLADRDTKEQVSVRTADGISILAVLADRDGNHHGPAAHKTSISILAVLADRDEQKQTEKNQAFPYFNPRGPCGPRPREGPSGAPLCFYFNPRGPCGPRRQSF